MCQSCSMPLNKDPKGGGLNADGSKSKMYCSFCYDKGAFRNPDMKVEEMQDFVKNKMKSMGFFMRIFAKKFVMGIPELERWKKK